MKSDLGRRVFPLGMSAAGAYFYAVQTGGGDIAVMPFEAHAGTVTGAPGVVSERYVGSNRWPTWSPDGRSLAYLSARGQMSPRVLVIRSMTTGRERDVPLPWGYSARVLRWAPDGRSLAFVGRDDRSRSGLFLIDVDAGRVTPVVRRTPGLQIDWVDWMPGGMEVVYTARDDPAGGSRLVRHDLATGSEDEMYKAPEILRVLAVSPDGSQVAVESGGGLHLIATRGGASRRQVRPAARDGSIPPWSGLAWTRDGRHLIFVGRTTSPAGSRMELRRVAIDSGDERPTGLAREAFSDPVLGAAGQLAFVNGADTYEVWVLEHLLPVGPRRAK